MTKLIMGIGIPGSGKTTVLKKLADTYNYSYICPDDIRLELTGDTKDQSKNKEVWDEAYRRMQQNFNEGKTVVFDATFTIFKERINFIDLARKSGAEKIQGIYVDLPLEIAKERNASRDRVLPEYALERMHKNLDINPPDLEDGFDSIFTVDEYKELKLTEMENGENVITKEFKKRPR